MILLIALYWIPPVPPAALSEEWRRVMDWTSGGEWRSGGDVSGREAQTVEETASELHKRGDAVAAPVALPAAGGEAATATGTTVERAEGTATQPSPPHEAA